MTERSADPDQSATPEDITMLLARAEAPGARYRDFSASRKQARGEFHHRMEQEQADRERTEAQVPLLQEPAHVEAQPGAGQVGLEQATPVGGWVGIRSSQRVAGQAPEAPSSGAAPRTSRNGGGPGLPMPWPTAPEPRSEDCLSAASEAQPPSREALASAARWHALQSVFVSAQRSLKAPVSPPLGLEKRPHLVAVFSLVGGVGKTSLVATLGRALSALGERVLLADTAAYGLLPFYFGSREFKPGVVRSFSPPGPESDAPVHLLSLEADRYPGDGGEQDPLLKELILDGRGTNRVLVDVATASRNVTGRLLLLRPLVLVPILPDMSSVASLGSIEAFLAGPAGPDTSRNEPLYLLNQFDASSPLHLDVREVLQQQLGHRLLPFAVRRSPAVSEALAEGMTVMDYAPDSPVATDYGLLADWLRSVSSQARAGYDSVRWSER